MCGPLSVLYMTNVLSAMPESIERLEDRADVLVVVDHRVVILALPPAGLADALRLGVRAEVHVGEVHPEEERLVGLRLPLDEVDGPVGDVVVDRLHPLLGQRAGVLDRLLADLAEPRVDGRVVLVVALQSSTPRGPYFLRNAGSLG